MAPSVRKQKVKVLATSFIFCLVLYLIAMIIGYLAFGDQVQANIILNIGSLPLDKGGGGPFVSVLITYAFVIVTSYPLVNFVARLSITNLVFHDHTLSTDRGWLISTWTYGLALLVAFSGIPLRKVLFLYYYYFTFRFWFSFLFYF